MALFGGSSNGSAQTGGMTSITECVEISGTIKGCGTIHIDGKVYGDIEIHDKVVIGEKGIVNGNIKSTYVVVSGSVNGSVMCESLEVTTTGSIMDDVNANTIETDGLLKGPIDARDTVKVLTNGKVLTERITSRTIIVEGSIEGNVESKQLLEVKNNGTVEGNLIVNNIKTEEGGRIFGSMSRYEEETILETKKEVKKKEEEPEEKE